MIRYALGGTCRLFCHNLAHTAHDQGAASLTDGGSLRAAGGLCEHLDGGIVTLDTGLGKTVVSVESEVAEPTLSSLYSLLSLFFCFDSTTTRPDTCYKSAFLFAQAAPI